MAIYHLLTNFERTYKKNNVAVHALVRACVRTFVRTKGTRDEQVAALPYVALIKPNMRACVQLGRTCAIDSLLTSQLRRISVVID